MNKKIINNLFICILIVFIAIVMMTIFTKQKITNLVIDANDDIYMDVVNVELIDGYCEINVIALDDENLIEYSNWIMGDGVNIYLNASIFIEQNNLAHQLYTTRSYISEYSEQLIADQYQLGEFALKAKFKNTANMPFKVGVKLIGYDDTIKYYLDEVEYECH